MSKKYNLVAFDLETTGLQPNHDQILQIGAVAFDLESDDTVEFNTLVKYTHYSGDAYALQMNQAILLRLATETHPDLCQALDEFDSWLEAHTFFPTYAVGWNVASFDLRFLESNGGPSKRFHHRSIELGTLFMETGMKEIGKSGVSIKTCIPANSHDITKKYLGTAVTHDALQDCRDAVKLLKMKVRQ